MRTNPNTRVLRQEMKSLELLVTGDVQGVGYRYAVQKIARSFRIVGFVKNQSDGSVRIIAEGESEEVLDDFRRAIAIKSPPVLVEDVSTKNLRATGRYKSFKIVSGPLSDELQEGFRSMESQFKDYRKEFKDYHDEFRQFSGKTDENFKTLGDKYGEISDKLTRILETLEKESTETRKELTKAVDNLSKLVDQYISENRTN